MIEKALSAGEDYKAADYIEQAAKEMGGIYTGRAASAIIPEAADGAVTAALHQSGKSINTETSSRH